MRLKVLIQPNAKKNEILGFRGEYLKVKIKAPPVEGKANDELIAFLASYLRLPKKNIQIILGQSNKKKILEIAGIDELPIELSQSKQVELHL